MRTPEINRLGRNTIFYKVNNIEGGFLVTPENTEDAALLRSIGRTEMGGGVYPPPPNTPSVGGFPGWRIEGKNVLADLEKKLNARGTYRDKPIKSGPIQTF